MAKKERPRPEKLSVYLYIPNIVGGSLFLFSFFFLALKIVVVMMILLIAFRVYESSLELCCFCCVFLQQATFLCPLFLQVLQLSSLMVIKIFSCFG